jgi:hypothetical protein
VRKGGQRGLEIALGVDEDVRRDDNLVSRRDA